MTVVSACKEFVFEEDRPFLSCHASTLIGLDNGDVLAAWFGGTAEGERDVDIWTSTRVRGVWSAPRHAASHAEEPLWNPVLYRREDDLIDLYYKAGHKIRSWRTLVASSPDGMVWSQAKELVEGDEGGRGPVKNKPIRLVDGILAAPASVETKTRWDAFVDLSSDKGASWSRTDLVPLRRIEAPADGSVPDPGTVAGKGVIQPTLWESAPGHVHMLLRSTERYIFRSDSVDGGRTWCEAYATELWNNNSGIDLTKLPDGRLALVCNPVPTERTPLVVLFSTDNGHSWGDKFVLEDGPGEYSYPAIINDGKDLHLTYTWRRERIAYWKLTVQ
ncbi:sialidase family protein [Paenibacillus hodogayensis]|uniref:Sialidase family protein n=1 Tax=Paenibacillus hodogayensis TaxID=279208 RepID=A0ABV5VYR4_9BACL